MTAVLQEEWREGRGRADGIVVRKLQCRQKAVPIVLGVVDASTKHILNDLVGTLRLSVCLRAHRRRHAETGAETLVKSKPELGGELGVAVGDDRNGESMVLEYMIYIQVCVVVLKHGIK